MTVVRYASVIQLKPETEAEYRQLHGAVWPAVARRISECNIRNYSIFLRDGLLFSYFEYTGSDFAADMAGMAAHPVTQRWWAVCLPCLIPLANRAPGEIWTVMGELFHLD